MQYRRAQGTRQLGTLVVIAMNVTELINTGKLMTSISAWNPASVEEARAVPRRQYILG